MDLMQRIRAFFAKLTYGSYGSDQLGRTILYTSIVLLFLVLPLGVFAVAVSVLVSGIVSLFINAWPNRRMLDYRIRDQLRDTAPAVLMSLGMSALVFPVTLLGLNDWATLGIMVPAGIAFYVGVSALLKLESFRFLLEVIGKLLHRTENGGTCEG